MEFPSVAPYWLAFLKEPVLLERWPSDGEIIDLPWELLDGISPAGKIAPDCKMLRWVSAKDIIGFASTSVLKLSSQAESKDSSL